MARKQGRRVGPAGNTDYIAHGADEHAALLGLRKAEEDDDPKYRGWALDDITLWGPNATDKFLLNILKQKVNELKSPVLKVQSDDPALPNYAPPLWTPG